LLKNELSEIIRSVKTYIEAEKLAGIEEFYIGGAAGPVAAQKAAQAEPLSKAKALEKLRAEVCKCRECSLCKTRKNPVFGEGNPDAGLVFVGEAPGRDEDLQGRPFVGRAGMLLTKIIQAMGFKRSDVYICNVLKCRPEQNRNPLPSEIVACQDYLHRQLEIIQPEVICCLGKFACGLLLKQEIAITKIRGTFQDFRGIKLMPTFHPAYLLRNPGGKALVWKDMQKIMAELKKAQ
jgi:DNA polymerase